MCAAEPSPTTDIRISRNGTDSSKGYCGNGVPAGNKYYDHLPVWCGGNAYFNGAQPWEKEKDAFADTEDKIELSLEERGDGWYLKTNLYEVLTKENAGIISTETLGMAFEPEQKFENPDGTPIVFDRDLFWRSPGRAHRTGTLYGKRGNREKSILRKFSSRPAGAPHMIISEAGCCGCYERPDPRPLSPHHRESGKGKAGVVMRMCEFRQKEVINICTGRRLGCVVDVEIDIRCGEVEAVIIPGPRKDLRAFRGGLRICDPVFLYPQDRTGYHPGGDTGRKVFAKVIDVVYNEGSFFTTAR